MLTRELIRARVGKKRVLPFYIDIQSPTYLHLAGEIIDVFSSKLKEKREEIETALKVYHEGSSDFLLVRGWIKLLFDRCEFATLGEGEPAEFRREIFEKAAQFRQQGPLKREALQEKICDHFQKKKEVLWEGLYSDLKSQQRLIEFKKYTPLQLLHRYNSALAQGVLLRALWLEVEVEGSPPQYRQLFRYIKFFRLLYTLVPLSSGRYKISLDGPLSLFQNSTKYGLQMANFLLALLKMPYFSLKAEVAWGKQKKRKTFELHSSMGLQSSFGDAKFWMPPEFLAFKDRFQKLKSPWQIEENPDVLSLGPGEVLIPDYRFIHRESGQIVYLEIFGYWKPRGMEKRLAQLDRANLLVALSKKLLAEPLERIDVEDQGKIYLYKSTLLPKEILSRLHQFEIGG